MRHQRIEVVRDRLPVAGVVDRHIAHPMPGTPQACSERAHGREDRQDFLRVMQHVVGFLPHFHQHIDHARIARGEPAVLRIELVAQNQAQRMGRRLRIGLRGECAGIMHQSDARSCRTHGRVHAEAAHGHAFDPTTILGPPGPHARTSAMIAVRTCTALPLFCAAWHSLSHCAAHRRQTRAGPRPLRSAMRPPPCHRPTSRRTCPSQAAHPRRSRSAMRGRCWRRSRKKHR